MAKLRIWHLEKFNIKYFPHMWRAIGFGARCFFWTIEVFIHAVAPWWFEDTSDRMIERIAQLDADVEVDHPWNDLKG